MRAQHHGRSTALLLFLVFALIACFASQTPDRPIAAPMRVLVGLRPDVSVDGVVSVMGSGTIRARVPELGLLVVDLPAGGADATVRALQRHPDVRYVERDTFNAVASEPTDPYYTQQWGIARVRAPAAWDALPGDGKTLVAVLDTGVDYSHPDLAGQISPLGCDLVLSGSCGADGRGLPARDINGHGTHVAGIIGALTNNRLGVASVTGGRVTMLPIKVSLEGGGRISTAVALEAIVFAVKSGAKVINMSFGGGCATDASSQQSIAYRDAIDYADRHDVLLVVAAGNAGGCPEGIYPASDPRVLSVAAVDASNQAPSFSGRGPWVSVAAPGVDILSTYRGGYASLSGTSMAAPHAAGVAALLFQVPGATKQKVMDWLLSTCERTDLDVRCGGVINASRAMQLALTGTDPAR